MKKGSKKMDTKKRMLLLAILCIIIISIHISHDLSPSEAFYDNGTTNNKSTDWICNNIKLVQVTPKGTLINNTSPEIIAYFAHSNKYWAKNPICIEFNVVDVTGNPSIHIADGENSFQKSLASANESHVKIKIGNTISWWIGNTEQPSTNFSMNDCYIRFLIPENNSLTYNDFKIYPT